MKRVICLCAFLVCSLCKDSTAQSCLSFSTNCAPRYAVVLERIQAIHANHKSSSRLDLSTNGVWTLTVDYGSQAESQLTSFAENFISRFGMVKFMFDVGTYYDVDAEHPVAITRRDGRPGDWEELILACAYMLWLDT